MTRYERYLKQLEKQKTDSENFIISRIGSIADNAFKTLSAWMDNNLTVKGGLLVASPDTIKTLNSFTADYQKSIVKSKPFSNGITDFIKSLRPISTNMLEFQGLQNEIDTGKIGISDLQKVVVGGIMDAYTENGLNAGFVQPLRNLLYQNIAGGTRLQDAKAALETYIKGGHDTTGKLERYLTQTTQQAVDSYTGAINLKLMQTFDFDHILMSGSIIKTSSPQCRIGINRLGGVITREAWEKEILPVAKENGLIAGTTFENLAFNKFHFACRHEFTPIFLSKGDELTTGQVWNGNELVSKAA